MGVVLLPEIRVLQHFEPGGAVEERAALLPEGRAGDRRLGGFHGPREKHLVEVLVEEAREDARRDVLRVLARRRLHPRHERVQGDWPVARHRDRFRPRHGGRAALPRAPPRHESGPGHGAHHAAPTRNVPSALGIDARTFGRARSRRARAARSKTPAPSAPSPAKALGSRKASGPEAKRSPFLSIATTRSGSRPCSFSSVAASSSPRRWTALTPRARARSRSRAISRSRSKAGGGAPYRSAAVAASRQSVSASDAAAIFL